MDVKDFASSVPKAELHLHIEGTLEPEMLFSLAARNGVKLPYAGPEAAREAYDFSSLQDFLDIYYEGAGVLLKERDFKDLCAAYLERAADDGVRHAEIFFDPQTHTARGVPLAAVVEGLAAALKEDGARLGVTSRLILCFLRHLSADAAMATLESALPYKSVISAVGLDSSEKGHPPSKFKAVFDRARAEGFWTVAHAGEEGPPSYIAEALDLLKVRRVDHGVRCLEDPKLVERLKRDRVPLTVCPLSNVRLRVFPTIEDHNMRRLIDAGLLVTVNSDDPAYFGGYVADNYRALQKGLGLPSAALARLAKNSFEASDLSDAEKLAHYASIDAALAAAQSRR
ncbi:MAG: adenosine deaminase [Elusimicrobia bacterium]|nr:MAG: adenosine deaminase [Elusimicrobiota bacterium]